MCILYGKNKNKAMYKRFDWHIGKFFLTWPFVFLSFCSPIFRVKSQGGQCRRFCNSFSIQRLIERGIHYLIKSSHFHPNCRINKSISLCRSLLCIWYKNQSFKFSHGNTMDDSYIYKTWVVFSFKNNDLHSSVCKLMFRGKSLQYVTTQ